MENWKCSELRDFWSLIPNYMGVDVVNFMQVCREFGVYGKNYVYSRNCSLDLAYNIRHYIDLRKYVDVIIGDNRDDSDVDAIMSVLINTENMTKIKPISPRLWENMLQDSVLYDMFYYFTSEFITILVPYTQSLPYRPVISSQCLFLYETRGYVPITNMDITEAQLLDNIDMLQREEVRHAVIDIIQNNPNIVLQFPIKYIKRTSQLCTDVLSSIYYKDINKLSTTMIDISKYAPVAYCSNFEAAKQRGFEYHKSYEIFNAKL